MDKEGCNMFAGMPWWVFAMIVFIFLSGYMAFRAMHAEKKLEQEYIEQEGNKYMERIAANRQLKEERREGSL